MAGQEAQDDGDGRQGHCRLQSRGRNVEKELRTTLDVVACDINVDDEGRRPDGVQERAVRVRGRGGGGVSLGNGNYEKR